VRLGNVDHGSDRLLDRMRPRLAAGLQYQSECDRGLHTAILVSRPSVDLQSKRFGHEALAMKATRFFRDRSGATAIEFALVTPVFLVVVGAVINLGLMMWTQIGIEHAAEAGARYASITASPCPTASAVQSYAATQDYGLGLPASTFTYSTASCGYQLNASYSYLLLGGGFPQFTTQLTASVCVPRPPRTFTCS
jgi:Flp pilus assembly protein TadG